MLRVFESEELDLQMQMISINGDLYFKAREVAVALGYKDPSSTVVKQVSKEYKRKLAEIKVAEKNLPSGSHPYSLYITEPGLYELVFNNRFKMLKIQV